MMTWHERSEWLGDAGWSAPVFPGWDAMRAIVVHYPGTGIGPIAGVAAQADALRRWNSRSIETRGYVYYYGAVIFPDGAGWLVRGFDTKNAANGPTTAPAVWGPNANATTWSVQVITDDAAGERVSDAAVATLRWAVADVRRRAGRRLRVVGHGEINATSCPGPALRTLIASGALDADPGPPVIPPFDPTIGMWSLWPLVDKRAIRLRSRGDDVRYAAGVLRLKAGQDTDPTVATFNDALDRAVRNLQAFFGLTVDGVIGPRETWPVIDWLAGL